MRRFLPTVALALATCAVANAAPAKVAFDRLFRAKASWRLSCVESHGDGRVTRSRPVGDLVCTIDATSRVGGSKLAHLRCAGLREVDEGSDLGQAFAPRTLVATPDALWSVADPNQADVTDILRQPPLLAANPQGGVRRENHGDKDVCCAAAEAASCKPCPPEYSGVEYTTSQFEKSWCVRARPWGTGGAPRATVFCVARDGALTGVAAFKQESDTAELRCGRTPADP
jgi:hypothetical protein